MPFTPVPNGMQTCAPRPLRRPGKTIEFDGLEKGRVKNVTRGVRARPVRHNDKLGEKLFSPERVWEERQGKGQDD